MTPPHNFNVSLAIIYTIILLQCLCFVWAFVKYGCCTIFCVYVAGKFMRQLLTVMAVGEKEVLYRPATKSGLSWSKAALVLKSCASQIVKLVLCALYRLYGVVPCSPSIPPHPLLALYTGIFRETQFTDFLSPIHIVVAVHMTNKIAWRGFPLFSSRRWLLCKSRS